MNKKICISLACALALNAADLGTISIESSTIDDKFDAQINSISSTTVISGATAEKINPTNVENILNSIPGITASNVGNDRVKIHIRGIDNQMYMGEKPGVAVIIDGVPVQETTGKINLDLDNIESIKVIKGSASYLYGNDAIAGAIIITTKRPKGISNSKIETEMGSFGFKRALASTNQSFDNSSLQLQGTIRDTDGYWHDSYLRHKSVNGKYQYYLSDKSDLTIGMDYTQRETGDGTSVSGITNAEFDPKSTSEVSYAGYYDTSLLKSFITYSNDLDDTSNIMASLSRYEDHTISRSARDANEEFHLHDNNEKWIQNTLKSEYRKSFNNFALMFGTNLERNRQDEISTQRVTYTSGWPATTTTAGTLLSNSTNDESVNALYTELQLQLTNNLHLTANYRYDNIKYDYVNALDSTLNTDPSYNSDSYRIGFNYALNQDHHIYTSYSTGFRAPTASQISGNIALAKQYPALNIPVTLDLETTENYELGIKGKTSSIQYDASIFQLDRNDYIGKKAGSYMFSTDDNEDKAVDNLGDMRSRGLELSIKNNISDSISVTTAYSYLRAKFLEYTVNPNDGGNPPISFAGNYVPRTSKHTLNLVVDIKPIDNLNISTELIAKGSYYADEANTYKQSGYEIINLRANYQVSKNLEIFSKIENLFDRGYYQFVNVSYGSDITDATIRVAPPRAYYAGLRYIF